MAFGSTVKKRIVRVADKIASMKQELDALSWGRVQEIGKQLQSRYEEASLAELGSELIAIAQSHVSLAAQLGIESAPYGSRTTPSGMGVIEGGLVEAVFMQSMVNDEEFEPQEPDFPKAETSAEVESSKTSLTCMNLEQASQVEISFDTEDAAEADLPKTSLGKTCETEEGSGEFEAPFQAEKARESEGIDLGDLVQAVRNSRMTISAATVQEDQTLGSVSPGIYESDTGSAVSFDSQEQTDPEAELLGENTISEQPIHEQSVPEKVVPETPALNEVVPTAATVEKGVAEEPVLEEAEPALKEEEPALPEQEEQKFQDPFARFSNLYESRDGSLCVFEDEHGHLVAVDASRLA